MQEKKNLARKLLLPNLMLKKKKENKLHEIFMMSWGQH